jgi:lipopolysaccharide export system protein LptA
MRFLRRSWPILVLLGWAASAGAAEPAAAPQVFSTNDTVILCTNGAAYSESVVVFHGDVHVFDPRMYLECEQLTGLITTNQSTSALAEGASLTNVHGRFDTIIAETNVLIMGRNLTAIGDRAVYTASNEVIVITGTLVVIEKDQSYLYGTHFVVNRITGEGYAIGPTTLELKMNPNDTGTNVVKPTPGKDRKSNTPLPKPKDKEAGRTNKTIRPPP